MANYTMIREVTITNGTDSRALSIESLGGKFVLCDRQNDPNGDSLIELAGDSDSDVQDALMPEWEVVQ